MSTKTLPVNIESDTFNAYKQDFNQMLHKLLSEMQSTGGEEGTLKTELKVKMQRFQSSGDYRGTREVVQPRFDHKIRISMQFKDEASGGLPGIYELVWDEASGTFLLRNADDSQESLFD